MKKYLYQFAGGTAYTSLALFAFCWIALWYGDFRIIGGYGDFDKSIAFGMFCIILYLAGNMLFVIKRIRNIKSNTFMASELWHQQLLLALLLIMVF